MMPVAAALLANANVNPMKQLEPIMPVAAQPQAANAPPGGYAAMSAMYQAQMGYMQHEMPPPAEIQHAWMVMPSANDQWDL
jgi:hypothetical protein